MRTALEAETYFGAEVMSQMEGLSSFNADRLIPLVVCSISERPVGVPPYPSKECVLVSIFQSLSIEDSLAI